MGRRLLLNLGLLALAALLVLLAVYEPGRAPPPVPPALTTLQADDIARIRLERPGHADVTLERHEGNWWVTAPVAAPANDWRVGKLLELAGAESRARDPLGGRDPAQFGLEPAAARVWLNGTPLTFGAATPLGDNRYVQVGGTLHRIGGGAYYQVTGPFTRFVSPRLLPPGAEPIGMEMEHGFSLVREAGSWRAQPQRADFSADQANTLARNWRHAQGLEVGARETAVPAEAPRITITLEGYDAPWVFAVAATEPELVLVRESQALEYRLAPEQAAALLQLGGERDARRE